MKQISQTHIDQMIQHAKEHDPNECCGILAGEGESVTRLYRVKNSTPSPFRYVMDPKEQLQVMRDADENGLELLCFYHSHTHSPAFPSDTDVRMAIESGWVDFGYVLVSLEEKDSPIVNFFIIDSEGTVIPEEYTVV
ncbi:M67 family metallopeptidase [Chloroflexi bacterium]|nr:M67 family metallopeptidase [Chloroflexota bacterium]